MQGGKKRECVPPEQLHSDLALFPRWHALASALPGTGKLRARAARARGARRGGAGLWGWVARWEGRGGWRMLSTDSASELHPPPLHHHPHRLSPPRASHSAPPPLPHHPPPTHTKSAPPSTRYLLPQPTLSFLKTLSTSHTPSSLPHPRTSSPLQLALCKYETHQRSRRKRRRGAGGLAAELECMRADKKLKLIFFN